MVWWIKFWIMETSQIPFQLRMAWSKAAFSLRRYSVWYSRPCWLTPSGKMEYRLDTGLTVGYPTSGGRRLLQKVKETVIRDFMFSGLFPQRQHRANDAAINRLLFSRQWQLWPYHQHQKTKVMCQPVPGKPYQEPHITVNLQTVDNVTYLGITLLRVVSSWSLLQTRQATQSFPPQLYFQTSPCQMADKITTDVIESAVIPSVHTLLQKAQVIWTSHVAWEPDSRLKKQLLNRDSGQNSQDKHLVGGQKKLFKDCLKESLKDLPINPSTSKSLAGPSSLDQQSHHWGSYGRK